ncbi:hypothetical protein Tco_0251161 [Tanacetum coccineum]
MRVKWWWLSWWYEGGSGDGVDSDVVVGWLMVGDCEKVFCEIVVGDRSDGGGAGKATKKRLAGGMMLIVRLSMRVVDGWGNDQIGCGGVDAFAGRVAEGSYRRRRPDFH